ncbi:MAG: carboxylating nicotinate-nucleotide diphosphorylase [Candidatus Nanopelagicales bacterium]|nr:carboxylating nicotinate-nucleotide diphosphorylase [Candidatus Nanopelagicales bacterium]
MSSLRSDIEVLLVTAGLNPDSVVELVRRALEEDLDGGVDVTTQATVPAGQRAILDLVARKPGVAAGVPVAAAVFCVVAEGLDIQMIGMDGQRVASGDVLVSVAGSTHDLLRAERPALNLLGHLSGIATATRMWVDAVAGTSAQIRDTRKTTPGMRKLEKYAVRCGGGVNHRMSLADAALVKDNHVVAAGGVAAAFEAVRREFPGVPVEVEVDSLEQLDEVLAAGADLVLLDNFSVDLMRVAVQRTAGRSRLEASGGLSLDVAAAVAATGVDYLAVGALTHSAPVLDIGADLRQES